MEISTAKFKDQILTVPEAAEEYRISPLTIWDYFRVGRLVRTKVAGKTFVRRSEMDKLVSDVRNDPRPVVKKASTRNAGAR